ncbi:MAG: nucleotidyltransferase domain-containing protein [Ktedonobacteraceae bacterium]
MQDERLQTVLDEQPHPLVFVTLSGSHLYGFSSLDSDYDLRGVHVLPVREVLGLHESKETIDFIKMHAGLEIDLVTHDVRKFFKLLLGKNGNALECIYSPLVVYTTPEHAELQSLAMRCVTRSYAHHYLGFATGQLKLFRKEEPRRVKSLLYIYRVILTGLHLMRTGQLEPNLVHLNEGFKLSYIPELIARKQSGTERSTLEDADLAFHETEIARLLSELEGSLEQSVLPKEPDPQAHDALNDLLIRLRLKSV